MSDYIRIEGVTGLRLTSKGKGLWCQVPEAGQVCVPLSQIGETSEIDDAGEFGALVVSRWWWNLPRVSMPDAQTDPDNRLKLMTLIARPGQTAGEVANNPNAPIGEEIRLWKVRCVWCGLLNDGQTNRCYHCSHDPRTGEDRS